MVIMVTVNHMTKGTLVDVTVHCYPASDIYDYIINVERVTIIELASQLGVCKSTMYKRLSRLGVHSRNDHPLLIKRIREFDDHTNNSTSLGMLIKKFRLGWNCIKEIVPPRRQRGGNVLCELPLHETIEYAKNHTRIDFCLRFNVSVSAAQRFITAKGVIFNTKRKDLEKQVIKLARTGILTSDIAERLSVNRNTVKYIRMKHNLPVTEVERRRYMMNKYGNMTTTRIGKEVFVEQAREMYGDEFGYILDDWKGVSGEITIVCDKHGQTKQIASNHLISRWGCPSCGYEKRLYNGTSKGEALISDWLDVNGVSYTREKEFNGCRDKGNLRFDFYVDSIKACIEFDGEQHFKPVKYCNVTDLNEQFLGIKR
jgi:Mn-dependent DtxR family transcriptional regulator